jgi:hypothetical protein
VSSWTQLGKWGQTFSAWFTTRTRRQRKVRELQCRPGKYLTYTTDCKKSRARKRWPATNSFNICIIRISRNEKLCTLPIFSSLVKHINLQIPELQQFPKRINQKKAMSKLLKTQGEKILWTDSETLLCVPENKDPNERGVLSTNHQSKKEVRPKKPPEQNSTSSDNGLQRSGQRQSLKTRKTKPIGRWPALKDLVRKRDGTRGRHRDGDCKEIYQTLISSGFKKYDLMVGDRHMICWAFPLTCT